MRSLVISGGGAKGAFLGGEFQALVEKGLDWDVYVGTSTGSILNTFTPSSDYQKLKDVYTSVNQNSIYPKVNPFTKKGKINIWNAIWRIIRKKNSLGEATGLVKLLKENFSTEDFYNVRRSGKQVFNCVVNMTTSKVEYINNYEADYHQYLTSVLASASVPLGFDLVKLNESYYLDGGIREHVPIQKAIDEGATEIDILISRPRTYKPENWEPNGMWSVLMRVIDLMEREISKSDVMVGQLMANNKDVKLNIYYTPRVLTHNSLIFSKEMMTAWWDEGYQYAKNGPQEVRYLKKKVIK